MTSRTPEARWAEYLAFVRERPELFQESGEGGIRLLLAADDIRAVEEATAAEVGIVGRDRFFTFLREAVEFPDGARRTHGRLINSVRGRDGAAVLPLFADRIVLTRQFRHGARRWMLEVPRGGIDAGSTAEETARNELHEEIGAEAGELIPLGYVHGSANVYYNGAHLFFARLSSIGTPQLAEAISEIRQVTVAEFETMLLAGEITDSFTVAAFCHARLRGLI